MIARLILEDGTVFTGRALGAKGDCSGEVIFTTGMMGYQETITDPSYCNQIVTFTYPLIGNYGINKQDMESIRPFLKGVVVNEVSNNPSNWQSKTTFEQYLSDCGITGISDIDTRKLTKLLRQKGTMMGQIVSGDKEITTEPNLWSDKKEAREVDVVTTSQSYVIPGGKWRVVVLDLGLKRGIIESLNRLGATVIAVPANTTANEILKYNPDGLLLSNGPGDPKRVIEITETIKALIDKLPIFGICLGHQLLGLTLGFDSKKLKFGHRGANHPVKDLHTGKVTITSQNHGYVLDDGNIPQDVEVTHVNLNDDTIEGIKHKHYPVFSVQYHPEASPGPRENEELLQKFIAAIENNKGKEVAVNA